MYLYIVFVTHGILDRMMEWLWPCRRTRGFYEGRIEGSLSCSRLQEGAVTVPEAQHDRLPQRLPTGIADHRWIWDGHVCVSSTSHLRSCTVNRCQMGCQYQPYGQFSPATATGNNTQHAPARYCRRLRSCTPLHLCTWDANSGAMDPVLGSPTLNTRLAQIVP